jgi:hypothetical protein
MRRLLGVLILSTLLLAACGGSSKAASPAAETGMAAQAGAGHPRLLVRQQDVARLRSWASSSNPLWTQGLARLANNARRLMDRGTIPNDDGTPAYVQYPTESYAELFAFMSMVHPQARARASYGRRARRLLMSVVRRALEGPPEEGAPFRDPLFSIGDRSRWQGEAYGLTVDWAYKYFSRNDKRRIRKLFVRWARQQYTIGYPLPILQGPKPSLRGKLNDPALISDTANVRWALNNYYIGHARNLGLMAMALDPRDDPANQVRSHLRRMTGTWLYVIDNALRTQAQGGFSPEGFEYGPDSFGRLAQLLYAMRTAGANTTPVAQMDANPVWGEVLNGYLSSLPSVPTQATGERADLGQIWQAASFGDEESYWALDPISVFGPMALDAAARGDATTVNAARWIATNVPPGGKEQLVDRVGDTADLFGAILYFLTFDPAAGEPTDPRTGLDLRFVAPSLNRTIARTCWCAAARMFTHKLSFATIDHQVSDGNDFGFHRNGEWLTKQRSGYDSQQTEALNIVTIGNDKPDHDERGTYPWDIWQRGGQWILVPSGDPPPPSRSFGNGFVALSGDATKLYNSDYENVRGVAHASRSIVWLEPDHVVVYDRATTTTAGRFKRFWLQTPAMPSISGRLATVATPKGQRLFSTTLLPENAALTASKNHATRGTPAVGEPMGFRLRVEAPGGPQDARFLHVVQGADGGAQPDPAQRVASRAGAAYDGAVVAGTAVLFPVNLGQGGATTIDLPAGVRRILVTGLAPGAGYTIGLQSTETTATLTLTDGGPSTADEGGTLEVTP